MPRIKKQWVKANENNTYIGVTVRVRNVITPMFGWGNVSRNEIGTINSISNGRSEDLLVDFPSQRGWMASFEDLEVLNAKD